MCSSSLFLVWIPRRSRRTSPGFLWRHASSQLSFNHMPQMCSTHFMQPSHIKHKTTTWCFNIKCYKMKPGWRIPGVPWHAGSRCMYHKVLLFYPAWSAKWCLTNLFYLLSYLKVKACTKWCLCGSLVPGAPGHEHIRKPLHQRPMAFPTLIRTETRAESGTTGSFVCKTGD